VTDPFARTTDDHERKQTELVAKSYDPDNEAEAKQLASLDRPTPSQRMALGYHQSAREAAKKIEETR
jgi:hypothetical protein